MEGSGWIYSDSNLLIVKNFVGLLFQLLQPSFCLAVEAPSFSYGFLTLPWFCFGAEFTAAYAKIYTGIVPYGNRKGIVQNIVFFSL
jgi:hypothetical protein